MSGAHVDINGVEQQSRTVWIGIEPPFESHLFEVLWLTSTRLNLGIGHEFDIRLLPIVRFGADGGNVEPMRRFHVRGVVETANKRVDRNVHRAFDVSVASQREIRQPAISRGHAELHRRARSGHRQIKSMLKLNLLSLGETKSSGDIRERFVREDYRARTNGADGSYKVQILDCTCEEF